MVRFPREGVRAAVRPTFMAPAVGMSLYGGALAPRFQPVPALLHGIAVAMALLVAHLNDNYVDGHVRGEESPQFGVETLRHGVASGTLCFFAVCALLWWSTSLTATVLTVPLVAFARLHAPYFDTHPLTVTADYPVAIGLVLLGGYATQTGEVSASVIAVAGLFALFLAGTKVAIDQLDAKFDRTVGKRTLPVLLGRSRANVVAAGGFASTLVGLAGFAATGVLPRGALAAAIGPIACLTAVFTLDQRTVVRVQMGAAYLFAAGLFVAVCQTDCSGWQLADGVLPPGTR